MLREQRDECGQNSDSSGRSFLSNRSFTANNGFRQTSKVIAKREGDVRHVEMDTPLVEELLIVLLDQSEVKCVRFKEREGDLRRLLDDFSELSGEHDSAASWHGLR